MHVRVDSEDRVRALTFVDVVETAGVQEQVGFYGPVWFARDVRNKAYACRPV